MRLSDSLLFIEASKHRFVVFCGLVPVFCLLAAFAAPLTDPVIARSLSRVLPAASVMVVCAALLIVLAGLSSAALGQTARRLMLEADQRLDDLSDTVGDDERICALKRAAWPAGWPQVLLALGLTTGASLLAWRGLHVALPQDVDGAAAVPVGVTALLACFPLVVVERHLAAARPDSFPEAEGLSRLVRMLLATVLVLGGGRLFEHAGFAGAFLAPRLAAGLVFAIGVELAVRTAMRCFVPFPVPDRAIGGMSTIAGLLRLQVPSSTSLNETVRATLGIDVSQSWALAFLRRALVPAVFVLCGVGWLLSGLVALDTTERGVYERLGRPVGVLEPGLHFVLPWPAGQVRRVELGVMHDLPLGVASGRSIADAGNDRLWDRPHPGDATYLIASQSGSQQSFQVVDIDMRIIWQVGDRSEDVLAFAYNVEAPVTVIRGLAGRLLAQRFAGSMLPAVLVEDRGAFIAAFRARLQGDCDALRLGVHVAAIVVEAIHPPAAAAAAYHAVQASELQAQVAIAQARGVAIETQAQTRQDVRAAQDDAQVSSAEIIAAARIDASSFDADRSAWRRDASAFLLERRLAEMGRVLPTRDLIIVDHRLGTDDLPLLDLRGTTALP